MHVTVQTPPDFQFRTTLLSHGWLELAPFRHDDDFTRVERIERLASGEVVKLCVTPTEEDDLQVIVERLDDENAPDVADEVRGIVKRIFNLNLDLDGFYEKLEGLDRYAWVRAHGGGRLLRAPTVWEDLAKTLLTTNTSWSMTRRMVERLVEMGDRYERRGYAFPAPERIAALRPEDVADQVRAGYRNAYLHDLAVAVVEGRIDEAAWSSDHLPAGELFKQIRSLKGFGPYAAGAMMKLLGRFEELALDSAARTMYAREFNRGDSAADAHIAAHYAQYEEWKGLVIWMDLMRDWFLSRMRQPR